jgi:hypothetical protein
MDGIGSKEHYELMAAFEKQYRNELVLTQGPNDLWSSGIIYTNGMTNKIFLAYRIGYSLGRAVEKDGI